MIKQPFAIAPDGIDPSRVPFKILNTGAHIPVIGLGTFGSDRHSPDQVAAAVKEAISLGYRHIDCASVYGNEKQIGKVLREVLDSGLVSREDMFITSKVWNDRHKSGEVIKSCAQSLKDLGLDYLDMYLVHWPFPNYHAPFCSVDARNPNSRPFFVKEFMQVWEQMEQLYAEGKVRAIGTSNVTKPKMEQILQHATVTPACNEMELHPHFQQQELMAYMVSKSILPVGFCPLGSPMRPDRDKMPEDTCDLEDPIIGSIAQAHGVHPALICLKWAVQNGQVPIPFSVNRRNLRTNLLAVTEDPLSDDEMRRIAGINQNCRLVKGHVFLWEGASGWENLWDVNGVIDRTGWVKN